MALIAALAGCILASAGARAADGRDGAAQAGCGSVADGRGGTVSGRAGGTSVATRVHRECPRPATETSPQTRAPAPPKPRAQAAPPPPAVKPIVSGGISLPEAVEELPSAFRGDLARASATVVTGGVVMWLLHSSLWASLLVLGVPIWRHVDLLPVVSHATDAESAPARDAGETREDAAVDHVLASARQGAAPAGTPGA